MAFPSSCVIFSIIRLVYCVEFYNEYSGETDDFSRKYCQNGHSNAFYIRKFAYVAALFIKIPLLI